MSFPDEALRAHADGDLCAGAAAGLLIAGRWPDRSDFAGRFITMAASPGTGTRAASRRLTGIPAARLAVTCSSSRARLVADAVLHASGHRGMR